ncbi:MAG: hypothetical protein ACREP8_00140 [Candidatus Binatia bacterium]
MNTLGEKLMTLLGVKRDGNRTSRTDDPVEILRLSYHDLSRLARQIDAHADRAPYPHVAERLRRIASEKRERAEALRRKMVSFGGRPDDGYLEIRMGKNHWERLGRDVDDQRRLESQFLERASLLVENAPEVAGFLQEIATAEHPHREILVDLLARADPQAHQT